MDGRIEDMLASLLSNIQTLDSALMRGSMSDIFLPSDQCFGLLEHIRESCISTLQNVQSIERKLQGKSFIIPDHIQQALE